METKPLRSFISFLIVGVFLMNFTIASVNIYFPAYNATLNSNGTTTYFNGSLNNQPVSNYSALVYSCNYLDCTTPLSVLNTFTTLSNNMTITFPTLNTNATYAIYFYKTGYIGWEQIINNIPANLNGSYSGPQIFFAKKQTGFAPIVNFSVYNEVERNRPIVLNVSVGVDAQTVSAIDHFGPLSYNPVQIESYRKVLTRVTLEIRNSANQIIHTNSTLLNIPYSGREFFSFSYPGFSTVGDYEVKVYTDIIDQKILAPIRTNASFDLSIIQANQTNYSYSLLREASHLPLFPQVNDSIRISFDYLSNFVNSSEGLEALNTSLNAIINLNGTLYETRSFNLPNLSTGYSPSSFNFSVNSTGVYTITLMANPNPRRGNFSIGQNVTLSFPVFANNWNETNQTNQTNQTNTSLFITILSPFNNQVYNVSTVPFNAVANQQVGSWFYFLNGNSIGNYITNSFNFSSVLSNLSSGNYTLQVCGTAYINYSLQNCSIVSFIVNLSTTDDDDDEDDDDDDDGNSRNICLNCEESEPCLDGEDILSLGNSTSNLIFLSDDPKESSDLLGDKLIWLLVILLTIAILIVLLIIFRL